MTQPISDGPRVIAVTDDAHAQIKAILADQPNADELALWLEIAGESGGEYQYDMYLQELDEASDDDTVSSFDGLRVVVPAGSVDRLSGATLDLEGDVGEGTLVLSNPNSPPQPGTAIPSDLPETADLDDPLTRRVFDILQETINPAIASHGGYAELVAVEAETAFLRLGGGCQGCGLATVTLSQGIEVAITEHIPEIERVVDVTDHAAGTNPYYEPAKK